VVGVDPSPPDRTHAPIVANNPRFSSIKALLETLDQSQLPPSIDWLLCDANIAPYIAFPYLVALIQKYDKSLKGFIFTVKLGDDLWGKTAKESIIDYLSSLEDTLYSKTCLKVISSTQLSANRQEVTLLGLSSMGMKRCRFDMKE
jgi:23S rRNA (cytidine2498-2'-O)-methyltransferase